MTPPFVRNVPAREAPEPDPRALRTQQALGHALVALLEERDFGDVTVQQILDRAGVARATFYAHYRNKEDALHASYERLFAMLDPWVERPSPLGRRLFPVTEFLAHVADARPLVDRLRSSGRMEEVWTLCAAHAARLIEGRLPAEAGRASGLARPLLARMLAGALMEAMRWWDASPARATPAEVEAAWHAHARGAIGVA